VAARPTGAAGLVGSNVAWGAGADILKGMFETIEAQLATAADKLKHLRRFL
jgi:hypothetical protein